MRPSRPTSRSRSCSRRRPTAPTWSASRATTTTSTDSVRSSPRPDPGRSSTSTSAPTTRRDPRLGFEPPSSSAGPCPIASSARSLPDGSSPKLGRGFQEWIDLGLIEGELPIFNGAQARAAARLQPPSRKAGTSANPSARRRSRRALRSATRPTAVRDRAGAANRRRVDSVTDQEIRDGSACLPRRRGSSPRPPAGSRSAFSPSSPNAARSAKGERVVAYITGEGLKTLDATRDTFQMHEISPDLESFESEFRQEVAV